MLRVALVLLGASAAAADGASSSFGTLTPDSAAHTLELPAHIAPESEAALTYAVEVLGEPQSAAGATAALALLSRLVETLPSATDPYDQLPGTLAGAVGATERVVASMRSHAGEEGVAGAACAALFALCRYTPFQAPAGEAGAVAASVEALRGLGGESARVAASCSAALSHLLAHPANKVLGVKARVPAALVAAMQQHPDDLAVVRSCTGALNNAAAGDAAGKRAVLASPALAAIVAALGAHRRDALLAEHACGALAVLATGEGGDVAAARVGGVEAAERALTAHLGIYKPKKESGRAARPPSPRVAAACARALAAISWSNDDVKRKARDALAPEALRLALETFPHEEAVQKWANRALSKIVDTAVEEMFAGLLADMPEGARA